MTTTRTQSSGGLPPAQADDLVVELATGLLDAPGPFAVLNLPGDVTGQPLRRAAERQRIAETVSGGAGDGATGGSDARQALQGLADPRARLVHELLWYRPEPGHLLPGRPDSEPWSAAVERWGRDAKRRDAAAVHNLAVHHLRDLIGDRSELGAKAEVALVTMADHLGSDSTAAYVAERVRAIGDRRLTADDAAVIMAALRLAVPAVVVQRALQLRQADDTATADQLIAAVHDLAPHSVFRAVVGRSVRPRQQSVSGAANRLAGLARTDLSRAPDRVAAFLDRTAGDRADLKLLLAYDPDQLSVLGDETASPCLLTIGAWLNDLAERAPGAPELGSHLNRAKELLERLAPLRCSTVVHTRIMDDLGTVTRLATSWQAAPAPAPAPGDECWLCHQTMTAKANVPIAVHSEVRRRGQRVEWKTATVEVPRCEACRRRDVKAERAEVIVWAGALALIVPYIVLALVITGALFGPTGDDTSFGLPSNGNGALVGLALYAATLYGVRRWYAPRGPARQKRLDTYPPLVKARADGWRLGARPPGV